MDQIKTGKYIITLIKALFNQTKPEEKPDDITFSDIYSMGKKHHILNMCFFAMEQLENKPDETLYDQWRNLTKVSSAQSIVQLSERDTLLRSLQNAEIDCLPLKGCYLKEMYPRPEYREMADLDILIRKESQEKVKNIMEELGYQTEKYDGTVHDVYKKPPFMDVEMHLGLFDQERIDRFRIDQLKQVTDPWNCAVQTELPFIYSFSPEDTYVFLMIHLIKHFKRSGVGIRQYADIWVYRQKYRLDQDYIYNTLKGTEVLSFCKDTENLVEAWFGNGKMTEELEAMQEYIFSAGVYGNALLRIRNELELMERDKRTTSTAFRYLLNRTFPPSETMEIIYPFLAKYPVFLPFTWVHRLIVKTFGKDSPAVKELKTFLWANRSRKKTRAESKQTHN